METDHTLVASEGGAARDGEEPPSEKRVHPVASSYNNHQKSAETQEEEEEEEDNEKNDMYIPPPHTKPPDGWRREVIPRRSVSGADVYYHSPCGERMRSKPDVQRFLDRQKKAGIDRYVGISPQQFDFSSRGVNVRTAPSTERDFNLLAGNWVFIPKKTDDEQSVEPARDSASKPKQHQGAAAASAEKAKKKKKPEKKNLEKLTTFERERLERIARNKEQLAALNIGPLAANMNDERGSGGGGGGGGGGNKRRRFEDEGGRVRRSLRGMNIPADPTMVVDTERRNGVVVLAGAAAAAAAAPAPSGSGGAVASVPEAGARARVG